MQNHMLRSLRRTKNLGRYIHTYVFREHWTETNICMILLGSSGWFRFSWISGWDLGSALARGSHVPAMSATTDKGNLLSMKVRHIERSESSLGDQASNAQRSRHIAHVLRQPPHKPPSYQELRRTWKLNPKFTPIAP